MSLLDRKANTLHGKEPLEDSYEHITKAQYEYIEILAHKLNLSHASRNSHILAVTKRNFDNDIWLLSKVEAGKVIGQFKKWIEERDSQ